MASLDPSEQRALASSFRRIHRRQADRLLVLRRGRGQGRLRQVCREVRTPVSPSPRKVSLQLIRQGVRQLARRLLASRVFPAKNNGAVRHMAM